MSENEPVVKEVKKKLRPEVTVSAFTVEADHPTNADLLIQTIGNMRLRSSIKPVKEIPDWEDGERVRRPVSAKIIQGLPREVRGMCLSVNPKEMSWKIFDPLRDEPDTLEKIQRARKAAGLVTGTDKLRGVPTKTGQLGVDEMKTLLKEIYHALQAEYVKVIEGVKPDIEDIDAMPGDYLLNMSNQAKWNQPRYEKDLEAWQRSLNQIG